MSGLATIARLKIPAAFEFLLAPSRYKAAFGGRGAAKSHSFATVLVAKAAADTLRCLCCREIQKSIGESVKQLLDLKISESNLPGYKSTETYIEHANGSVFLFAGLRSNPDSIKSMEALDIAWVEEANRVSRRSLDLLIPTVRKDKSELWFSWNPENEFDPVDLMFRGKNLPPDSVVRKITWRDNKFFPAVLKQEMEFDRTTDPDKYEHIWEGAYRVAAVGAYFKQELRQARTEGRVAWRLAREPLLPIKTYWDLGTSDHTAVWVMQFIGKEIRCLSYVEGSGQPLAYYLGELRTRGYGTQCEVYLPHDGANEQLGLHATKSVADHFRDAGFRSVHVIKNQGKGAAMARIEAARRVFPRIWFDGGECEHGLKRLAAYHERIDEQRNIGLGPEHDENSHGSDAFGLACVTYREPAGAARERLKYDDRPIV